MNFCLECGEELEMLGGASFSSAVWLYGCSRCDILWGAHGCSVSGRIDSYEKNNWKLSDWKKYNQNE